MPEHDRHYPDQAYNPARRPVAPQAGQQTIPGTGPTPAAKRTGPPSGFLPLSGTPIYDD